MKWLPLHLVALLLPIWFAPRTRATEAPRAVVYHAAAIYSGDARDAAPVAGGALYVKGTSVVRVLKAGEPMPPDADVVDLGNAVIIPGLVTAGGMLGPDALGAETAGAQYQALDAFDFYADQREWLSTGITTAYLDPGRHRLIAGVGAVVKLAGEARARRILQGEADLRICVSEGALDPPNYIEPPVPPSSDVPITPERVQRPTSRLGVFLELRELFARASALDLTSGNRPGFDFALAALRRSLDRGMPLRMHARRADEIRRAVAFGRGRRFVISGATEAHQVASELRGVGVVLELSAEAGRIGQNRDVAREQLDASVATAATLDRNGVRFALAASPSAVLTAPEDRMAMHDLLFLASSAVGAGLEPARALAALTSDAAAILGVSDRVGSLTPNHDADFVVITGEPFAPGTSVRAVYVDGVERYRARASDTTVVSAGHILTMDGNDLEHGAVMMSDGKITGLGSAVAAAAGAHVESFDANAYVVPGFIDALGHLGMNGDRGRVDADLPIHRVRVAADAAAMEVARAGITTTIVAPYAAGDRGARIAALKTAGEGVPQVLVDATCGLLFPAAEGDILELKDRYKSALDQGKAYFDRWQKYAEELKKWEDEQKQGAQPKKDVKPADDQAKKESRTDAISGKWEATVAGGGPSPEPQKLTMYLKLDGTRITGKTTSPMRRRNQDAPSEVGLSGTLEGDHVVLELEAGGGGRRGGRGGGAPRIDAKLDKPEHMVGTFGFGNFGRDFEATRVEKGAFDVLVVSTRRKKLEDTRPPAPPVDEKLEPYRRLFKKEIPAVVPAAGALEIRAIVTLFADDYGLPLVLVGPTELKRVRDDVRRALVSVILPTALTTVRDNHEIEVPIEMLESGLPIAFQSDAENAAQDLPALVSFAVHRGLDPTEALKAITINAAKAYQIDDRVGSLRVGKDADVLVFSGPPLSRASRLLRVYVQGREVYRRPAE